MNALAACWPQSAPKKAAASLGGLAAAGLSSGLVRLSEGTFAFDAGDGDGRGRRRDFHGRHGRDRRDLARRVVDPHLGRLLVRLGRFRHLLRRGDRLHLGRRGYGRGGGAAAVAGAASVAAAIATETFTQPIQERMAAAAARIGARVARARASVASRLMATALPGPSPRRAAIARIAAPGMAVGSRSARVASIARVARVAIEQAAQTITQPMAETFAAAGILATAATTRAATRGDDRRWSSRRGWGSGLLVRTAACLTDQHCRRH